MRCECEGAAGANPASYEPIGFASGADGAIAQELVEPDESHALRLSRKMPHRLASRQQAHTFWVNWCTHVRMIGPFTCYHLLSGSLRALRHPCTHTCTPARPGSLNRCCFDQMLFPPSGR